MLKNPERQSNGAMSYALLKRRNTAAKNALARGRAAKAANVSPAALKFEEARHYLGGISGPSLTRLVQRGLIRPNRFLRHHVFSKAELDRYLAAGMTE
jgi:hypothetical protein